MFDHNRPLETLAATAITFVAGMLTAGALSLYSTWMKQKRPAEAGTANGQQAR
jgi:hypothetical protein